MPSRSNFFEVPPVKNEARNVVEHSVDTIINYGLTAEGTLLPPKQQGDYRIPAPTGFMVVDSEFNFAGTIFTLSWIDIEDYTTPIAQYNIYAQSLLNANQEPTLVGSSTQSPCVVRVIASEAAAVVFYLQPVLINGITLPLDACPSTTGDVPDPIYVFSADDDNTGLVAEVRIAGDVPWQSGTTVGLSVSYPDAVTPPLDDAYCTITGVGVEAFAQYATQLNGTGVAVTELPGTQDYLSLFSEIDISGSLFGFIAACDGTGTGGDYNVGERAALFGNGFLHLRTLGQTDTLTVSSIIEGSAGSSSGEYIVVEINTGGGPLTRKLQLFNYS